MDIKKINTVEEYCRAHSFDYNKLPEDIKKEAREEYEERKANPDALYLDGVFSFPTREMMDAFIPSDEEQR